MSPPIKKLNDDQTKTVNEYLARHYKINKDLENITLSKTQLEKEKTDKDKAIGEQKQQFEAQNRRPTKNARHRESPARQPLRRP